MAAQTQVGMNPSAETTLWTLIALGNGTARDQMIMSHKPIVGSTARQYVNGGGQIQFEELQGEGHVALCEAVETYQIEDRTYRFGAYAKISVRRAIVQFTRTREGTVTKPEWETKKERKVLKDVEILRRDLGRNPTHEEVAFAHGIAAADSWERLHDGPEYIDVKPSTIIVDPPELPQETPPAHIRTLLKELSEGASLGQLAEVWQCPREQLKEDALAYVG